MDLKEIHIGNIIKDKLNEKSMSVTELALLINRQRSTVYDIFERKSIDTELLIKIGTALNYDFILNVYYPDTSQKAKIIIEVERSEIDKFLQTQRRGGTEFA